MTVLIVEFDEKPATEEADDDMFVDELAQLATDIGKFLRKKDRACRTTDPDLQTQVSQELENLKSRVKGLAVDLGVIREVLQQQDRSLPLQN